MLVSVFGGIHSPLVNNHRYLSCWPTGCWEASAGHLLIILACREHRHKHMQRVSHVCFITCTHSWVSLLPYKVRKEPRMLFYYGCKTNIFVWNHVTLTLKDSNKKHEGGSGHRETTSCLSWEQRLFALWGSCFLLASEVPDNLVCSSHIYLINVNDPNLSVYFSFPLFRWEDAWFCSLPPPIHQEGHLTST